MTSKLQKWISYSVIGFAVAFVAAWLIVRIFLFDIFRVPSASMYPTMPEGSFIIVDKRRYGHYSLFGVDFVRRPMTASVARGDILVHQLPDDVSTFYVKRVIGLPGDEIEYTGNRLTINDRAIATTDYRVEGPMTFATEIVDDVRIPVALDSTRISKDYRNVVPKDHYVVFGDNRNNSMDSRFVGPISKDLIVGKVVKVYPLK